MRLPVIRTMPRGRPSWKRRAICSRPPPRGSPDRSPRWPGTLSPARAATTRLRTGALSKQSGPVALRLLRLFTVSTGMLGVLALTGQAAAQCTPVAAQAPQPSEPVMCQCRIGPVTIEAPVCEIKTRGDDDERAEYIDWKNENGIWQHI